MKTLIILCIILVFSNVKAQNFSDAPGKNDTVADSIPDLYYPPRFEWFLKMLSDTELESFCKDKHFKKTIRHPVNTSFLVFFLRIDREEEMECFLSGGNITFNEPIVRLQEVRYGSSILANVLVLIMFWFVAGAAEIHTHFEHNYRRYFIYSLVLTLILSTKQQNPEEMVVIPSLFFSFVIFMYVGIRYAFKQRKIMAAQKNNIS